MALWTAEITATTPAAPERVWALWVDADRWPEANPEVVAGEMLGPLRVGTVERFRFRRGSRVSFTIVDLDPPRKLVHQTTLPGARLGHEHRLDPVPEGTRILHRLYLGGPLSLLYAALLGRHLRRALPGLLDRERVLAEGALRS